MKWILLIRSERTHEKSEGIPKTPIKCITVFGHSHVPKNIHVNNTLYFNPGSAEPRRFNFRVTVGQIKLSKVQVTAEIIPLLD